MQWGPSEDVPDDPDDPDDPDRPDDQHGAGGWLPPEVRAWRHPSEMQGAPVAAVISAAQGWRRSTALAVGVSAISLILVGTLLLVNTGSSSRPASLDTMPVGTAVVTPCCTLSPTSTRNAVQSVVSLQPASGGAVLGCGVVVGEGLVATVTRALAGERRVRVVAATGRYMSGTVVATDAGSGLALLHVSGVLPAAAVDATAALGAGTPALAVAVEPGGAGHASRSVWRSATVVAVGKPPPRATAASMAEITVRGATIPVVAGEPLVDRRGRMLGILDSAAGAERSFLPMALVDGVADDLKTTGKVLHGWLGVSDATPKGTPGALVVWVDPHGAAAHALRPGDVIVSVDGWRVHSSADLRSMLYVMPPGTTVDVAARRSARVVHAVVELAPSP